MNNDNTDLPQNEEVETDQPESPVTDQPESPVTEQPEPIVDSFDFVQLVPEQHETLVGISQRTDLLTNRVEVMLLLDIILVALFIFQMMRGKNS